MTFLPRKNTALMRPCRILFSAAIALPLLRAGAGTHFPSGTSQAITLAEDTPYHFADADFGFSDPLDSPADEFTGVLIGTLPSSGSLSLDGTPVTAGSIAPRVPIAQKQFTLRTITGQVSGIACSADGQKLVVAGRDSGIQLSDDSGVTWTPPAIQVGGEDVGVACSADRTVIVTGGSFSVDSGQTFQPRSGPSRIAGCSADGSTLMMGNVLSTILLSDDGGSNWDVIQPSGGILSAGTVCGDGSLLVAGEQAGPLLLSSDGGATWTSGPLGAWNAVAASHDGSRIYAGGWNSALYISADRGLTWTEQGLPRNILSIACSADGRRLIAVEGELFSSTQVVTSIDYGQTWTAQTAENTWAAAASSASGLRQIAAGYQAAISDAAVPQLTYTPPLNAQGALGGFLFQVQDGGSAGSNIDLSERSISLIASPVNDAPVISPLANVSGIQGSPLSYTIAPSRIQDVDHSAAALTVSMTAADGSPLPSWLTFNPVTWNLTGTPPREVLAPVELKVMVTDSGTPPLGAETPLRINITNIDDPPEGTSFDLSLAEDQVIPFSAGLFGFSDPYDPAANLFTRVRVSTLPANGALLFNGTPAAAGDLVPLATIPPGNSWTANALSRGWYDIDCSADGARWIAAARDWPLYVSSDYGRTWTTRSVARNWYSVASSADGSKLMACVFGGLVYSSSDAGQTWTALPLPSADWRAVAISGDGSSMAAMIQNGSLYTMRDGTWRTTGGPGWYWAAYSHDGARLAAVIQNGRIATSVNGGITWTARELVRNWRYICSSSDGQRLAATVTDGQIYTSSDAGVTWVARETARQWYGITCSSDGMRLAAAAAGGQIHFSEDAGATWRPSETARGWRGIASSADGNLVIAGGPSAALHRTEGYTAGSLTYQPALNFSGTDSFMFQLEDNGATGRNLDPVPDTVSLTVTSRNDAPTVIPARSLVLLPLSPGAQQLALSGISAGGGESQPVSMTVESGNLQLIPAPTVSYTSPDPTGTLHFTPQPGIAGDAVLTVSVTDTAPAEEGGSLTGSATILVRMLPPFPLWAAQNGLPEDPAAADGRNLLHYAFGMGPQGSPGYLTVQAGTILSTGHPVLETLPEGGYAALYAKRPDAGLIYSVQFSHDLTDWETSASAPVVIASNEAIEACRVPFPIALTSGKTPRFFRIMVTMQ